MVSVIVPVYNTPKELEMCLNSLKRQTFKDFEVLVVDDGSVPKVQSSTRLSSPKSEADGGHDFKVQREGLNVFFYRIEHGGVQRARNFGFSKSRGEFVLFCDADLELRQDCLEKMYKKLKDNPDKSYVYSDFKYGSKKFKFWDFDAEKLKEMNYINTCSLLRRRDFTGFDEDIQKFQDWDLWLTLLEQGKTGIYIPGILFKAHVKRGNMSFWLPHFVYNWPLIKNLKRVKDYRKWKKVVQQKHKLFYKE